MVDETALFGIVPATSQSRDCCHKVDFESVMEKREMSYACFTCGFWRDAHMHAIAVAEIGQQAVKRSFRSKRIVGHSDGEQIAGHSREMRECVGTRAPVGIFQSGWTECPLVCRCGRQVFMPTQGFCREVSEQRSQCGHQSMPAQPHAESLSGLVVAPICILRTHGDASFDASVVFGKSKQQTADAVSHHIYGYTGAGAVRPVQRGIAIVSAPVQF